MRTVAAIVVGFVVWSILLLVGNQLLMAAMPDSFSDAGLTTDTVVLALQLLMTIGYSIASGWIAARIAKTDHNKPAMILGCVLLAVGIAVQVSFWSVIPVWYHLLFLGFLLPMTMLGGRLGTRPAA